MIPFPHPRLRPAARFAAGLTFLWTLQRLMLLALARPGGPAAWVLVLVHGLRADLAAAAWLAAPAVLWLGLAPGRWLDARGARRAAFAAAAAAAAIALFGAVADYFFFQEFDSRLNVLAVDYLLYPREVLGDIRAEYPLWPVLAAALAAGAAAAWLIGNRVRRPDGPADARARRADAALFALAWAVLAASAPGAPPRWSDDRVRNELSGNGLYGFGAALLTRDVRWADAYRTLPRADAYARTRRLLGVPGVRWAAAPDSIVRDVPGDAARPRRNVVVILAESFGSEFWGALGRVPSLTPRMDTEAAAGLLCTRIYANGDRTQRGMEGALASFPPLPGATLLHRRPAVPVATLARTLRTDGYATTFIYGGRGAFDGMRPWALANGWDRFIEQDAYTHPAHVTVWGVSDEDLFGKSLEELRALHAAGRPFFATILTVSNHKPYTFPAGRIPERPEDRTRVNAVKYSDWAMGDFFSRARREPFWADTIFVVIADHGAKVYGSPRLPIRSHEIPILFLGPAAAPAPRRVATLGSSLDVPPTVLGLLGRPYRSAFFGRDLLHGDPRAGRAPMNHNRESGLLTRDALAILGMGRSEAAWRYDPATRGAVPVGTPTAADREAALDAAALYQVADEVARKGVLP